MDLMIERNPAGPQPYVLYARQINDTLIAAEGLSIPVYLNEATGTYNAELAGFRIESPALAELPALARPLLDGLITMARLPSYVFVARRSGCVYPVYTVGDEVFATTPGGPVFRHVELAKVREHLADYLHLTGVLGAPGRSDKLHVRGVDQATLELIRPAFYFKKRVRGETDFWAPVFANDSEIWTYAASARRSAPRDGGREVLTLQRAVAEALIADKRLRNPYDLRPDRLFPEHWEQLRSLCTLDPQRLNVAGVDLALLRCAETVIAVELRCDQATERPSLYLDRTIDELTERIAADFTRRGVLA